MRTNRVVESADFARLRVRAHYALADLALLLHLFWRSETINRLINFNNRRAQHLLKPNNANKILKKNQFIIAFARMTTIYFTCFFYQLLIPVVIGFHKDR